MSRTARVVLALVVTAIPSLAQTPKDDSRPAHTSHAAKPPADSSSSGPNIREIEGDIEASRFLEAQAKTRNLLDTQPLNALAWTYLGIINVGLQQGQRAIQAFEHAISLSPEDARPYLDVALVYETQNNLDKAIDRYKKGLSLDDRNAIAYHNYGRLLMRTGRLPEAIDALNRAVSINHADVEARIALVEALLRAKRRQDASHEVQLFLAMPSTLTPVLVSLGSVLVRGGEFELSKAVLHRAILISPDSAGAQIELSRLHVALGQSRAAISAANRATALAPISLEANLALAEALMSGRQHAEALKVLAQVQPRFGNSAQFQCTLGLAQLRIGNTRSAISTFTRAVQLDPGLELAHFLLGDAFRSDGDLEKAEASFKAAILLNPKKVLYYNSLAQVYEREDNRDAALEMTNRALILDPKDIDSRLRLAERAKQDGDLPRARALLEQIVADDPTLVSSRVLLATVYYRLNLRKEGDEQRKTVLSLQAKARKHQFAPERP